ncbi:D-alanyl-D-alanine carboxypeptidase / D-alanyl-D-alanine-endopeptidase (penicillin-binding protein 4) [Glycomyces sambucus]|uniref:D-alanyl-D-alanine carboxypeptidase / D-alanyl-D-alanine-endopeptidase (Penicillin-binding protein 4) n=1 Tax=Glycomyces sambucus TaxID=380244 RepID=A0A1G9H8D5_9ACTN|nr:D-alanyl-D-alanine carboxypeptidase/D-alanyl-D-alanine-endopeptidase [Glycomyces sambucus]SDL09258.1 D-alanyl-D-alanine carboxypeptidase / D-alanyl-D-alanine-endopeptidase (penicillin-binding protein 4) [Glycomyces sambucus]
MKRRTLISGAAAVTAAGAMIIAATTVAQAEETGNEALAAAIDAILQDPKVTDSQASIIVKDAATGEVVYDHHGNQRAIPASNNKLSTVAGALEVLGEDFTFTTDVVADAPVDGTVSGDLYLRGSGDPSMLAADYRSLADQLVEAGVTTVDGDLVADDTAFDAARHGDVWSWSDVMSSAGAEISALTIGSGSDHLAGTVRVYVRPGATAGSPAVIETVPETDYVTVESTATTGTSTNVQFSRDEHANTIRVSGTVAAGSSGTYGTRAVIDPTGLAADVFADALDAAGIDLLGDVRLHEETPQGGESLASHSSATLADLTDDLMKPSNNLYAEAFFKAAGLAQTGLGTFASGKAAIYSGIEEYGVNTGPIRQVDGSGMSRWDELTPDMLTDLLIGAQDAPWFDTYHDSLPVACVDGTLLSRMCGTEAAGNVRAKTGSLTSVSALSGFVTDADGRELVFSVMFNDFLTSNIKGLEDQIAVVLASYSADTTESEFATFAAEAEEIAEPAEELPADWECSWYEPSIC